MAGRVQIPFPEALVRQLEHSAATGARCVIDLTQIPDDEQPSAAEIADLKKALVRARYRLFPDKTVRKEFTKTEIRFWVENKGAQ